MVKMEWGGGRWLKVRNNREKILSYLFMLIQVIAFKGNIKKNFHKSFVNQNSLHYDTSHSEVLMNINT